MGGGGWVPNSAVSFATQATIYRSLRALRGHVDRRVVGCSAGRHVDHPCGGQISPWPASTINTKIFAIQKILRGINFVKLQKIFSRPPPQRNKKHHIGLAMSVDSDCCFFLQKKSVAATNSRKNYKKNTPKNREGNYHAPQKRYLPEKNPPELFLKLPLPDLSFSELISKNYPIPSVFV